MFALRLIGLLILVAYSWSMGQIPGDLNSFGKFIAFAFFLAAPALYFLPTFEAWNKGHPNLTSIALVNFFLGWSLIGWVVAIVWAFKRPEPPVTPAQVVVSPHPSARDTKVCPFCAEEILVAATKCKHCGSEVPQILAS